MEEKTFLVLVVVLFVGFIVFFISRSGENSGMLKPSSAVTDNFQSYRAVADLDYWFSGPESHPLAIIGIENRFRFDSAKHWMKV